MRHERPVRRADVLRQNLDRLVETFDVATLSPDPLELVRRYEQPLDQEVVGLLAAAFAYGRADVVVANVGAVLDRMEPSPYHFLAGHFNRKEARARFRSFTHRFHKVDDLVTLLETVSQALKKYRSLGALFASGYDPAEKDIGPALQRFIDALIAEAGRNVPASLRYLLTSPRDGSACKRMNLFLRWMVRREEPDLGLWTFADPAKLVIPLDTHIHRITRFLGLNARKSADWKAARAITDRLAGFNAADPVRYDFAICRLGILDLCSRKRRKENCDVCLLREVCRFPVR